MRSVKTIAFAAAVAIAALAAKPAVVEAASLSVVDTLGGSATATILCGDACEGLVAGSIGALSTSEALTYDQPTGPGGASAPNVALLLNSLAGTSFTDGVRTDMGSGVLGDGDTDESASFSSTAEWVAFKFGTDLAFVKNTAGVGQTYDWTKLTSSGLSNITEFGGVTAPIPLPAAGWMLIAGVAGLVAAGRRRRA